jgi:hypothetical protein
MFVGGLPGPRATADGRRMTADRDERRLSVSARWWEATNRTRLRTVREVAGDMAGKGGASSSLCVCRTNDRESDRPCGSRLWS